MLPRKGRYFATIATDSHRAPPPAPCPRIVVEEKTTLWIGAEPKSRAGSLGNEFSTRPGHRSEQPVQASLTSDEFDFPGAIPADKFVVPLGDTQDFVYWLDPLAGNSLFSQHRGEYLAQGGAEPPGLQKQSFSRLMVRSREGQKVGAAFLRDDPCRLQEPDKTLPGQVCFCKVRVRKIQGKPPTDRRWV